MRGKRGVGKKRIVRKSVSITNELERKLNRLSKSTDLAPATLLTMAAEAALDSAQWVNTVQAQYCADQNFWWHPSVDGKGRVLPPPADPASGEE